MQNLKNNLERYKYNFKELCEVYNRNAHSMTKLLEKNDLVFIEKNKLIDECNIPNMTQTKIADKYGMSLASIRGLMKKYNLDLNIKKNKANVELVRDAINDGLSINEISKTFRLNRSLVKTIIKENSIEYFTCFETWEKRRNIILKNINKYKIENKTKTLKDIANEENISVEQLKWAFKEKKIPVKLHSYNRSKGEIEVETFIKSLGLDCHMQKFENTFEIDCFVPDKNFGIEYCGEYWHSYKLGDDKNYHQNKALFFKERNISIMTIFESEFLEKRSLIESMIKQRLGISERVFARKCHVSPIQSFESKKFHKENHISGYVNSSINLGLFHNEQLISVLSLSKSRFDKNYQYEITRYSTKAGFTVIGGFSKMFSFFTKEYNPTNCLTYADLRFGHGNVYPKSGFKLIGKTNANYWYYDKNNPNGLESRLKYQNKKIVAQGKTELEKMSSLGYYRIYDCGSFKYSWSKD